jgi:SAM-dependent methyltransferase
MDHDLTGNRSASPSFWLHGDRRAACPVCRSDEPKDVLSSAVLHDIRTRLAGPGQTMLEYMKCRECHTVFAPLSQAPRYEQSDDAESIRYYLEEGAGIDLLMEPLFKIDTGRVRRFVEVGCSFGFSLDAARHCFGWEVLGIDPSPSAAAGRDILRVPIDNRYLTEERPVSGAPADLLLVPEVIEHVTDPHAFMRALLASLSDDGIVIISTPNAGSLNETTTDARLMSILQPQVHLVLYSEKSLTDLVTAHGLSFHHCQVTQDDITIFASRRPFVFHPDAAVDRGPYLNYLEYRLDRSEPGSALRRGMYARLLKEHVFQGRFREAEDLIEPMSAEFRASHDIDLRDVESVFIRRDDVETRPYSMQCILYCLGMIQIIYKNNKKNGIKYLEAAANWPDQAGSPKSLLGFEDASSAAISHNARCQIASARIALDPIGEFERLVNPPDEDAVPSSGWLFHHQMLFVELTNLGYYDRANQLYEAVAAAMGAQDPSSEQAPPEGIGHRAMALYALGILALNYRNDPTTARAWFAWAASTARVDPALGDLGRAIESALRYAADPGAPTDGA